MVIAGKDESDGKNRSYTEYRTGIAVLRTTKELCEYLGLKETTVRSLIRTGEIPHVRIKGSIRILATDVRAYLEKNIKAGGNLNDESGKKPALSQSG